MYTSFSSLEELIAEVEKDKNISGSASFTANRYPVRFVLFDNFRDSFDFVTEMQSHFVCGFQSVSEWMDSGYTDVILTHTQLADRIKNFISDHFQQDYILTPFSELARFYDNTQYMEFDALVKTVKAIETSLNGFERHQRVYIPIVGLEGKMAKFSSDSQIHIWYYKNADKQLNYNLILTNNSDYRVGGLNNKYTIINNIQDWLSVWRDKNAKPNIISTSPALFANAEYAQPDNAFNFCTCNNVYEFLTKGLHLDLTAVEFRECDIRHWDRLAAEIDINDFSFEKFFNKYFQIHDLSNYSIFIETWFKCQDEFEKWLLANFYSYKFCQKGYICQVLKRINNYIDRDFIAEIALSIFEQENIEQNREEREVCMKAAAQHGVQLTYQQQEFLKTSLENLANKIGNYSAISFFTPLTDIEKKLSIQWLAQGKISQNDVQSFFPELCHYLGHTVGDAPSWIFNYIDIYKKAKLANKYSEDINEIINEKNASEIDFNTWINEFRTTKTHFEKRNDIEVFYWIDGLGIEWIPFIKYLLDSKSHNGIYLNDIMIARAKYPSTTENNKPALESLSDTLEKIGDLDAHAHKSTNQYPDYILEEFEIVKGAIDEITTKYSGKKIAIVSDHGLTALSQLCDGLNLVGFTSDHHGRLALRSIGNCVSSNEYLICDDKKTVCALRHKSLCNKVPNNQSSHGGCTPEEILVPIFIISSQKESSNWTATLLTREVSTPPVVQYEIKGLSSLDIPYVFYDNKQYQLHNIGNFIYESEQLSLNEQCNLVELAIGHKRQADTIAIKLAAEEDDIFSF